MSFDLSKPMSLAEVRTALREALSPKYGQREAAAMAREIILNLKGWNLPELLANEQREASDFIKGKSEEILTNLLADMPLQYALGEAEFYGLKLKVAPGVLIPRPETAELVDIIVKENQKSDLNVLDICTGSGAIAIALARNLPFARVEAIDISPIAVSIATQNAQNLKTRVKIEKKDLFKFEAAPESFDIIVSNPPYIDESEKREMAPNVLDYEPHEALFVPDDNPLLFYRKIAELGETILKKGGRIYFEINPRHASDLKTLMENAGYTDVSIIRDIHGKNRFLSAIK